MRNSYASCSAASSAATLASSFAFASASAAAAASAARALLRALRRERVEAGAHRLHRRLPARHRAAVRRLQRARGVRLDRDLLRRRVALVALLVEAEGELEVGEQLRLVALERSVLVEQRGILLLEAPRRVLGEQALRALRVALLRRRLQRGAQLRELLRFWRSCAFSSRSAACSWPWPAAAISSSACRRPWSISLRSRSRAAFAAAAGLADFSTVSAICASSGCSGGFVAPRGDFFGSVADAGRCANALRKCTHPLTVDCGGAGSRDGTNAGSAGCGARRRVCWIDAAYSRCDRMEEVATMTADRLSVQFGRPSRSSSRRELALSVR